MLLLWVGWQVEVVEVFMLRVVVISCAFISFFFLFCSNDSKSEQDFVSDGGYFFFEGDPEEGIVVLVFDAGVSIVEVVTVIDVDFGSDLSALFELDTVEFFIFFLFV